jgi:hypothetical protein
MPTLDEDPDCIAPRTVLELLYVQHYRILRRALACMGHLERSSMPPWQQIHQVTKFLGSVDAELITARDLLEEYAQRQGIPLPSRTRARELAAGANSKDAKAEPTAVGDQAAS